MRSRYYSPILKRFVNADILHGSISDSTSLNRYSYVNGNPISYVDPTGLEKQRGELYNRDAAVEYAEKYAYFNNLNYMPLNSVLFTLYYGYHFKTFTGMADCANFVSQCLEAGGFQETDDWYYYSVINMPVESALYPDNHMFLYYYDQNNNITSSHITYCFSPTWTKANAQYNYFSDKSNGYTEQDPIMINSEDDIQKAICEYNIQKGDLLYWSSDEGETVHHATMISDVTDSDILFAGHSDSAFNKSSYSTIQDNGETIVIVMLNDYL